MSIYAEDIDNAVGFLPGLFKFDPEGQFEQAVLALAQGELLFYNDNAPDSVNGADWSYNVKLRIPFQSITLATHELIITKRKNTEETNRLVIETKGEEKPVVYRFYYYENKSKFANNFMMGLKRYKVKTKVIKTKLSY